MSGLRKRGSCPLKFPWLKDAELFSTSISLYGNLLAVGQCGGAYVFKNVVGGGRSERWERTVVKEPAKANKTDINRGPFGFTVSMSGKLLAVSAPGKVYIYQTANLEASPAEVQKPNTASASFGVDLGLSTSGQHLFVVDAGPELFKVFLYTRTVVNKWSARAVFDLPLGGDSSGSITTLSPAFAGETFVRNTPGNISFYEYSSEKWALQSSIEVTGHIAAADNSTLVMTYAFADNITIYERQGDNQWTGTFTFNLKNDEILGYSGNCVSAAVQGSTILFGVVGVKPNGNTTSSDSKSSMFFVEKTGDGTWVRGLDINLKKMGLKTSGAGRMLQMDGDTIAAGVPPFNSDSSSQPGVVYILSKEREMNAASCTSSGSTPC